jgi:hypothetical protein
VDLVPIRVRPPGNPHKIHARPRAPG